MSKRGQLCLNSLLASTWECTGLSGHLLCLIFQSVLSNYILHLTLFLNAWLWCVHWYVSLSGRLDSDHAHVLGLIYSWYQKPGRLNWVDLTTTWSSQKYLSMFLQGRDCGRRGLPKPARDGWEEWGFRPSHCWVDCESKPNYWRDLQHVSGAGQGGLCMCKGDGTSNRSRAVALTTCMYMCQQLWRLGSRGSYWVVLVSELSYWKDQLCTYVYAFPVRQSHPGQWERGTGWSCCYCSCLCECFDLYTWIPVHLHASKEQRSRCRV